VITADCDVIREELDAFVDGELRGADLRRVADHLDGCKRCSEEIEDRQKLGGLIRDSVSDSYHQPIPTGLAAGVVARTRAETYFSWRAGLGRAVDDWHWIIVGGGAVTSTFVAMLFCAALLLFGTATPNAASLSTLGYNLAESPGALYAEVSQQGGSRMMVQVDTGSAPVPVPEMLRHPDEERLLVEMLGFALARGGAFVQLASMPEAERRYTEWLLANLARVRGAEPVIGALDQLTDNRLHLVTNTDVTAKGLD
jgi:anti-sigma factor RsiW